MKSVLGTRIMFELEKWDKHSVGDKLTRMLAKLNNKGVVEDKCSSSLQLCLQEGPVCDSDPSFGATMGDERKGYCQASLKNRKKNLKEGRRRKRKKLREIAEDDEVVDSQLDNTDRLGNAADDVTPKLREKLNKDMPLRQNLCPSNESSSVDGVCTKRKLDRKNGLLDRDSKTKKAKIDTEFPLVDCKSENSSKSGEMCIPRKSKRNKYFHMTQTYLNLKERLEESSPSDRQDGAEMGHRMVKISPSSRTVKDRVSGDVGLDMSCKSIPGEPKEHKPPKQSRGQESPKKSKDKKPLKRFRDNEPLEQSKGNKPSKKSKHNRVLTPSRTDELDSGLSTKTASKREATNDGVCKNLHVFANPNDVSDVAVKPVSPPASCSSVSSLTARMEQRLSGARFRYINEQLYSCSGSDAWQMFHDDASLFRIYHRGYENQVAQWPVNPLDVIIQSIKMLPKSTVIADFGCGAAKLASSVKQRVHSFDLVALNELVTACDMSQVPLADQSVDVVVFCLSLMGTNIADYLREANRILKPNGRLKIAEVASRIRKLHPFVKTLSRLGFALDKKDTKNTMFLMLDFAKVGAPKATQLQFTLPPCVYKPR